MTALFFGWGWDDIIAQASMTTFVNVGDGLSVELTFTLRSEGQEVNEAKNRSVRISG